MKVHINSNQDKYNSYDLYRQYFYDNSILSECERNIEQFKGFIENLREETKKVMCVQFMYRIFLSDLMRQRILHLLLTCLPLLAERYSLMLEVVRLKGSKNA